MICVRCESGCPKWLQTIRFSVFAGGFPAYVGPGLLHSPLCVPSLHFLGRKDLDIPPDAVRELSSRFENCILHEHDGGHIIPNDDESISVLKRFLISLSEWVICGLLKNCESVFFFSFFLIDEKIIWDNHNLLYRNKKYGVKSVKVGGDELQVFLIQ